MRNLRLKTLTTYAAGLFLLASCSSDSFREEPVTMPDDSPFWLTFSISNPETDSATRAETDKETWEANISSLIAVMVDNEGSGKGTIVGCAQPTDILSSSDNKSFTATVNMGLSSLYLREHEYSLYVFANLPESEYASLFPSSLIGQSISSVGGKTVAMGVADPGNASSSLVLKMASEPADVEKIMIWLKKNDDGSDKIYSKDTPYVVQTNPAGKTAADGTSVGSISLTPLQARLDFIGHTSLTFPITFSTENETGQSSSRSELNVEFKKVNICNANAKAYLLPQSGLEGFTWTTPALTASLSKETGITLGDTKTLGYVAENIPSSTATFSNTTYLELKGVVKASENASTSTKTLLSSASHPSLFYFDDGTFQSALTAEGHIGEADWHELKWDAALGGYAVTYRHAIRHDAGEGKNLDDGTIHPMEYAVVRNYLYEIGIRSVSSLPHKWSATDPVENGRQDISIQISPAKWIGYHRGGVEIEY